MFDPEIGIDRMLKRRSRSALAERIKRATPIGGRPRILKIVQWWGSEEVTAQYLLYIFTLMRETVERAGADFSSLRISVHRDSNGLTFYGWALDHSMLPSFEEDKDDDFDL